MRRILTAITALLLLSACDSTQSLVELRHAAPASDPYTAALAHEYQQFADQKLAAYEWWTSKYFADKGLLAAYGQQVEPEDPSHWEIDAGALPTFTDARTQLAALIPAARTAHPEETASAMVAYDRWVVLASNHWNEEAIEDARDRFYTLIGKLADVDTTTATQPTAVETTSTILYFPFDSARLSGSAAIALQQLVDYVKSAGNVGITINGHADRAGSDDYNMVLSEQRALFVRQALLDVGVPENLVQYFAFGETDPDVPTDDGVAEPLNRRVEIYIE